MGPEYESLTLNKTSPNSIVGEVSFMDIYKTHWCLQVDIVANILPQSLFNNT